MTPDPSKWPADKVQRWPVTKLIPYARNARTHSAAQVAQIAASITEWGWTNPVLIDEAGMMIAGHGRVLAAHKLGITEVPVMVATGWTEAQKRSYVLADNQLGLNAGWDMELLKIEAGDLSSMGVDLALIGFDAKRIDELLDVAKPDGDTTPQLGVDLDYSIVIRCTDEDHQAALLGKLEAQGLKCEVLIS